MGTSVYFQPVLCDAFCKKLCHSLEETNRRCFKELGENEPRAERDELEIEEYTLTLGREK